MRWRTMKTNLYFAGALAVLFFLNVYFANRSAQKEDYDDDGLKEVDLSKQQRCEPRRELSVREQTCSADNSNLKCWKDDVDVYVPFSYVKKRFDMSAKMNKEGSSFDIYTSYSKTRVPETVYDPRGEFGHFATYSVETRDRVRCISAEYDVPMSTQWDTTPYFYPIQIAQYGLQHYSRFVALNSTRTEIIKGANSKEWKGAAGMSDTTERLFFVDEQKGNVVNISTTGALANAGAYVYLDNTPQLHVIEFEWMPVENASFTVLAKMKEGGLLVLLNYVTEKDSRCVWNDDEAQKKKDGQVSFSYSLGESEGSWQNVSRDVLVDVARALSSAEGRKKDDNVVLHPGDMRMVSIGFRGKSTIRQHISVSDQHHESAFLAAAHWLVTNQNDKGGWSVPVERSIADKKLVLAPGWHSAMAQGHGISLLTRAYAHSGDISFLNSASKALDLFEMQASAGGVRNELFGVPWYEEYPTTPGSFVLNGFLYSLIGLYDFSQLVHDDKVPSELADSVNKAGEFYRTGLDSLRQLLPLYDTGSGSIYDLRHVHLHTAPNLARWDYHAVHVYLLKWIANIENDTQIAEVVVRWTDYANGKRAKHN